MRCPIYGLRTPERGLCYNTREQPRAWVVYMSNLQPALDRLVVAGLIRQAAQDPDLEFLFRHVLVQEAAYASLLKQDRRRLHAQVGTVLEQDYAAHPRL